MPLSYCLDPRMVLNTTFCKKLLTYKQNPHPWLAGILPLHFVYMTSQIGTHTAVEDDWLIMITGNQIKSVDKHVDIV